MQKTTLKGFAIVEGLCEGEALVSKKPLSFLGGVDQNNGKIIEKNHDLHGKRIKDKALCFPHGHGSTVGSYVLYSLAKKNLAPKAIINQEADPVVVVGAIIAEIPMVTQIEIDKIQTGNRLQIDGYRGIVKILQRTES
jgi:hypothetical protein